MNFTTRALESLAVLLRAFKQDPNMALDAYALEHTIEDLHVAKKFLIPSPGHLNVVAKKEAFQFMRLPYPICAFEYSCPEARNDGIKGAQHLNTTKSTRRIALAYDCRYDIGPIPSLKRAGVLDQDAKGILVQSIFYLDSHDVWAPSFAGGYVDEANVNDKSGFLLDNKRMEFSTETVALMPQSLAQEYGHLSGNQLKLSMLNDVADELGMTLRACLLLNTRNLKIVKAIDAPAALNKKRAKTGKPPFFEYHTLDIFISDSGSRLARKKVDSNFVQQHFAHMQNTRKWGTVTGHFKMRSTGMFWWNAHSRGSKEAGVVNKQYHVKPK